MFRAKHLIIATLFASLTTITAAYAGDSPEEIKQRVGTGNPVAGKEKSTMCQGCHGEDGNSAAPNFPKLAGQYALYIQKQIREFKSGVRKDPIMSDMAATITSEQDLLDISAYFASQK
ncbi:MAG: cytochrome c, partial [Gallionellaceae bacterium]|nr:cytochrome c [Gallionellaceae bacterium]